MISPEIDALKQALGADTDFELAAKLGLSRSAVAQWRQRGAVPSRLRHLLQAEGDERSLAAVRQQVFRKPEYHYWLRAALALAPAVTTAELTDAAAERRERMILHLIGLAMKVTRQDLRLSRIADEGSWSRLMSRLRQAYEAEIAMLVREHGG